ncbi:hypothetical protein DMN91_007980 [Ooceraea biroi]|uniref:Uncharacterized protein n=1 Tax=Ooceraea biroi TaxID=2015173 RepID=A0A3L8DGX0_OOCBI|nr:hypothetical protein DMN91_007980 [Ooceraea biroi]
MEKLRARRKDVKKNSCQKGDGNIPQKMYTVLHRRDLRWNVCALLSRILSVLGKIAFCKDTITFANTLRQGLLQLPRDSKQWNDAVAYHGEAGTALMISLYYHFLGTRENDMISLESLIVKILSLQKFTTSVRRQSSVQTLKPLWFLFAVTSLSHPQPHLISNYTDAVTLLTTTLQRFELSEFYTHHIDLLHYCLKCPDISQNFVNRVLDLWLIESDGDIKPLLPFNHDKVVRRLLASRIFIFRMISA